MTHHFDDIIDRKNTHSVKWDFMEHYLQLDGSDLLPMWVSDFDFKCPEIVQQALHQRVEHGVFGYSERDNSYYQAVIEWFHKRHQLEIKKEWFASIEGVVPGLALLIQLLSKPGDGIVIQGPYYGSFAKIIGLNDRKIVENPLQETPDGYRLDFAHLETCFKKEAPPLLILCNPHNPTGRCWSHAELMQLMTLCRQYHVTVISDEIWADLVLPGNRFTSILHVATESADRVIAATSASKSFGLSSLRISNFLIPDDTIRRAFIDRLNAHGLDVFNVLSITAATTAYQQGEAWLDELLQYLGDNRRWFEQALAKQVPWCKLMPSEGTYLAWLDCRALALDDKTLLNRLIDKAKIAPSMGIGFGPQGSGFIRINLGCPREYLEQAIKGLARLTL